MPALSHTGSIAPSPGVLWGLYPQRSGPDRHGVFTLPACDRLTGNRRIRRVAAAADRAASEWMDLPAEAADRRLAELRVRLHRQGLDHDGRAAALGCVVASAQKTLGVRLYATQLFAASALLDGRLAEMATGEGKTLAAGAAAAAAALAGIPVHVITANDYLVARDAAALAPWYAALGLRTGRIVAELDAAQRRAEYAADIAYCTARELAFDYLRDGLQAPGRHELVQRAAAFAGDAGQPRLRGLCMAILDEADNVLLDEAAMPLVLSASHADPERRAFLWQALTLARALREADDFVLDRATRRAELTACGRERMRELSAALSGPWRMRRRAEEAVAMGVAALHLYRRDRDYLVDGGCVLIVDPHTGRPAHGRVWSQGLHGLIELKERVPLSEETRTLAQITYQRFFPRYLRLCGMSGTLREARRELRKVYGLTVVQVALRQPSRRLRGPARAWSTHGDRWSAVVERIRKLHADGRPVLIGTASVADSEALGRALDQARIAHRVLNARRHRQEASIVAQAGQPGAVTIATQMAGRGTDIALTPEARRLGGLHIIDCQGAAPRRLERQLAGRCARQGDPGSFERWMPADTAHYEGVFASILAALVRYFERARLGTPPQWLLRGWIRARQGAEERRGARARRLVLEQDRAWARRCSFTSPAE